MLDEVRATVPFDLVEVDIDTTDQLIRDYGYRVPVVAIDGAEVFEAEVDRAELTGLLQAPAIGWTDAGAGGSMTTRRPVPDATVTRLPLYLRALVDLAETEGPVSSDVLAAAAGVTPAKVRKDLSYLGSYGTRGRGYDAGYLIHQIRRELGLTQAWPIVIAGIGNLGHALANYRGFGERGFRVAGLVDADPAKVGVVVAGLMVRPVEDLEVVVRDAHVAIGVIATPAAAVQKVADRMVAAGLRSILNFAPAVVSVPEGVTVRKVDLAIELQILAYYEQRSAALRDTGSGRGASARS